MVSTAITRLDWNYFHLLGTNTVLLVFLFPLSFLLLKPQSCTEFELRKWQGCSSLLSRHSWSWQWVCCRDSSVFFLRPVRSGSWKVGATHLLQLPCLELLDMFAALIPRGLKSSRISAPRCSGNSLSLNSLSLASKCFLLNTAFLFSHFPSSGLVFLQKNSPGVSHLSLYFFSRSASFPCTVCWILLPLPFPLLSGPESIISLVFSSR